MLADGLSFSLVGQPLAGGFMVLTLVSHLKRIYRPIRLGLILAFFLVAYFGVNRITGVNGVD